MELGDSEYLLKAVSLWGKAAMVWKAVFDSGMRMEELGNVLKSIVMKLLIEVVSLKTCLLEEGFIFWFGLNSSWRRWVSIVGFVLGDSGWTAGSSQFVVMVSALARVVGVLGDVGLGDGGSSTSMIGSLVGDPLVGEDIVLKVSIRLENR